MALTASQILLFPASISAIQQHARGLLHAASQFPGITSIFATEQRGMMANIGLSLYFEAGDKVHQRSIVLARFLDRVEERAVASRNTADTFIKEMIQYGYLSQSSGAGDKRIRPLVPTEKTMLAVLSWALEHLKTLDQLDGGDRANMVMRTPEVLAQLQPNIADDLVGKGSKEVATGTLALFAWVNKSKLLFLRILASIKPFEGDASRHVTDIDSIAELAIWMNVSSTHLARKLRDAETMGSLGWCGDRGQSSMWISTGFMHEIAGEYAARLAFFDEAYDLVFAATA
ncbi:MAG: hypothetical protein Q7S99_12640 [Parvibaculum sp.]|nr:hypothetical protein [Parvibaculum sp.]|tara:strand:+ start:5383 stop:6243 length:861 start_codon:yes stop_codon:yes gene_type:complete